MRTRDPYGGEGVACGVYDLAWTELMHYLYLPVRIPEVSAFTAVPERLAFAWGVLSRVIPEVPADWNVYLTARRAYTPVGEPLNRPGWHCDGFGTDDINWVWADRWGTLIAPQRFYGISRDHLESLRQFDVQVGLSHCIRVPDKVLYRLDPYVVHAAPHAPEGGFRSFLKVSASPYRYNLEGNSHNYLLDYDWPMHPRDEARNDPTRAGGDFV